MGKLEQLTSEFMFNLSELIRVNIFTGYWDSKRNDLRKKIDKKEMVPFKTFVDTERFSRKYVEQRAVHRGEIENITKQLAELAID